jgi:hypothetical protein
MAMRVHVIIPLQLDPLAASAAVQAASHGVLLESHTVGRPRRAIGPWVGKRRRSKKPLPFGRDPGNAGDVDAARDDTGEGDRCRGLVLGSFSGSESESSVFPCRSCCDSLIVALSRFGDKLTTCCEMWCQRLVNVGRLPFWG